MVKVVAKEQRLMQDQDISLASMLITPCGGNCGNRDLLNRPELAVKTTHGTFLTGEMDWSAIEAGANGVGTRIQFRSHILVCGGRDRLLVRSDTLDGTLGLRPRAGEDGAHANEMWHIVVELLK